VVPPRQSNVRSLLLKYASLFGIVAICSVIISILSTVFGPGSLLRGSANTVNAAPEVAFRDNGITTAKAVAESVAQNGTTASDVFMAVTKGVGDAVAANVTPAMASTPSPTMMAPPPAIPAGPLESGAGAMFPAVDPALAFFLGGVLVIFILVCYEAWVWKRLYK